MVKKFLQNASLMVAANLVIKSIWILGIDRGVQNRLGTEEYGQYVVLFNTGLLLLFFADLGVNNYHNRFVAQNPQMAGKSASTILISKFILGFIYLALGLSYGLYFGYSQRTIQLLLVICCNWFLTSLIIFLRGVIGGLQQFKTDTLFSVSDRFILILIVGFALWFSPTLLSLEYYVYSQMVALGIVVLVLIIYISGQTTGFRFLFDFPYVIKTLKNSVPFAVLFLFQAVMIKSDTIMLERLLVNGHEQAGVYMASQRLMETLTILAYLISVILFPMFSKMIAQNENIKPLVKTSALLMLISSLIVFIIFTFYHREIMNSLYTHPEIVNQSQISVVVILSFVWLAQGYIWGTLLTANGNMKILNMLSLVFMLVNLGLNYYLIPKYQAMGAAISFCVTQGLFVASEAVFCAKIFWWRRG